MTHLTSRIENKIWELIIPWLKSNQAIRELVIKGYTLQAQLQHRSKLVSLVFWVSAGFSLGLGLGTILAILKL